MGPVRPIDVFQGLLNVVDLLRQRHPPREAIRPALQSSLYVGDDALGEGAKRDDDIVTRRARRQIDDGVQQPREGSDGVVEPVARGRLGDALFEGCRSGDEKTHGTLQVSGQLITLHISCRWLGTDPQ